MTQTHPNSLEKVEKVTTLSRTTLAATLCVTTILLASCSDGVETVTSDNATTTTATTPAERTDRASVGECSSEDNADNYIEANHNPKEPIFSIPLPEGWERTTKMDSELVRLTTGDRASGPEKARTAILTVEPTTVEGTVMFDQNAAYIESTMSPENLVRHPETSVCGLAAQQFDYTTSGMGGATQAVHQLLVSVPDINGSSLVAVLTVQSAEADASDFAPIADTIISGIRVEDPTAGQTVES